MPFQKDTKSGDKTAKKEITTSNRLKHACACCFRSLGVDSRMTIYSYLETSGEAPVGDIVEHVGLRQPTVSYHLKAMHSAGLVGSRRAGRSIIYFVAGTCPSDNKECVLC